MLYSAILNSYSTYKCCDIYLDRRQYNIRDALDYPSNNAIHRSRRLHTANAKNHSQGIVKRHKYIIAQQTATEIRHRSTQKSGTNSFAISRIIKQTSNAARDLRISSYLISTCKNNVKLIISNISCWRKGSPRWKMAYAKSPSLHIFSVEIRDLWEKKLHLRIFKWRLEDTAKRNMRFDGELEVLR